MSENITTIARPYANAVYEHAIALNKLKEWSGYLQCYSMSVVEKDIASFIANPATSSKQHIEALAGAVEGLCGEEAAHFKNFIATLAQNKRISLLPEITALFELMRAEHEKTMVVEVISFSELTSAQQQHLVESLSKRLGRKVSLNVIIDESLIGGAIIRADRLVIDGSVRSLLNKFSVSLAA